MGERGSTHTSEGLVLGRSVEVVDEVAADKARQDAEAIEAVRRSGEIVTAAEHKAIYGSSARDVEAWFKRQEAQKAMLGVKALNS